MPHAAQERQEVDTELTKFSWYRTIPNNNQMNLLEFSYEVEYKFRNFDNIPTSLNDERCTVAFWRNLGEWEKFNWQPILVWLYVVFFCDSESFLVDFAIEFDGFSCVCACAGISLFGWEYCIVMKPLAHNLNPLMNWKCLAALVECNFSIDADNILCKATAIRLSMYDRTAFHQIPEDILLNIQLKLTIWREWNLRHLSIWYTFWFIHSAFTIRAAQSTSASSITSAVHKYNNFT